MPGDLTHLSLDRPSPPRNRPSTHRGGGEQRTSPSTHSREESPSAGSKASSSPVPPTITEARRQMMAKRGSLSDNFKDWADKTNAKELAESANTVEKTGGQSSTPSPKPYAAAPPKGQIPRDPAELRFDDETIDFDSTFARLLESTASVRDRIHAKGVGHPNEVKKQTPAAAKTSKSPSQKTGSPPKSRSQHSTPSRTPQRAKSPTAMTPTPASRGRKSPASGNKNHDGCYPAKSGASPQSKSKMSKLVLTKEIYDKSSKLARRFKDKEMAYFFGSCRTVPFTPNMLPLALNGASDTASLNAFDAELGSLWNVWPIQGLEGCYSLHCADRKGYYLTNEGKIEKGEDKAGVWIFETTRPFRNGDLDVTVKVRNVDGLSLCSREERKSVHLLSADVVGAKANGYYIYGDRWELTPFVDDAADDIFDKYLAAEGGFLTSNQQGIEPPRDESDE